MTTYDKSFKEEALKLSDEIGVTKAAAQLGIPYYTLSNWRYKQHAYVDPILQAWLLQRTAPDKRCMRLCAV